MKVLESSRDRLVLADDSGLFKRMLVALVVIGIPLVIAFFFLRAISYTGETTLLMCSRANNAVTCKLNQHDAYGNLILTQNISKVQKAIAIEKSETRLCSKKDTKCKKTYQACYVRLATDIGIFPVEGISSFASQNGCPKNKNIVVVNQINSLVQGNTTKSLNWYEDTTKGDLVRSPLGIAILGGMVGLYMIWFLSFSYKVWIFDQKLGNLTCNWKAIWRQGSDQYPLAELIGIDSKKIGRHTSKTNYHFLGLIKVKEYTYDYYVFIWQKKGSKLQGKKIYLYVLSEFKRDQLISLISPFLR